MESTEEKNQTENQQPEAPVTWVKKNMTTSLNAANLKRLQDFVSAMDPAAKIDNITKLVMYFLDSFDVKYNAAIEDFKQLHKGELLKLIGENENYKEEIKNLTNRLVEAGKIQIPKEVLTEQKKQAEILEKRAAAFVALFPINQQ